MKISKTVETEYGSITFEGEVTQQEYDLIMEVGLNVLLAQGAIPFTLRKFVENGGPDEQETIN